jgi:hypothetical protein
MAYYDPYIDHGQLTYTTNIPDHYQSTSSFVNITSNSPNFATDWPRSSYVSHTSAKFRSPRWTFILRPMPDYTIT